MSEWAKADSHTESALACCRNQQACWLRELRAHERIWKAGCECPHVAVAHSAIMDKQHLVGLAFALYKGGSGLDQAE